MDDVGECKCWWGVRRTFGRALASMACFVACVDSTRKRELFCRIVMSSFVWWQVSTTVLHVCGAFVYSCVFVSMQFSKATFCFENEILYYFWLVYAGTARYHTVRAPPCAVFWNIKAKWSTKYI